MLLNNKYLLLISFVMVSYLFGSYIKKRMYSWSVIRNPELQQLFKNVVNQSLNKTDLKKWKCSELRDITVIDNDAVKYIDIETYIIKKSKWNDPEKLVKIKVMTDNDYNILDIETIEEVGPNDVGRLLPENTTALRPIAKGLIGKVREFITSTFFGNFYKVKPVYEDVDSCMNSGASTVICKGSHKMRTDKEFVELPVPPTEGKNVSNEDLKKTGETNPVAGFKCELIKPYYSSFHIPHSNDAFVCRQTYEVNNNPNAILVDESTREIKGELSGFNL